MSEKYITASEMGDFVYCKRSWWLKRKGLLAENGAMKQGTAQHDALAKMAGSFKYILALALLLVGVGLIGIIGYFAYGFIIKGQGL